jgi:hypothetical protein
MRLATRVRSHRELLKRLFFDYLLAGMLGG